VMTAPPWPAHPAAAPSARDDFDQARLHPHWVSVRSRPAGHCSTEDRPGWLTLRARGESLDDPDITFVGRRQQHLSCRARTLADAAEGRGGLAVRLDERHHYELEVADGEVRVSARIGPLRQIVGTQPAPSGPVVLRIEAHASMTGLGHPLREPDLLSFGTEDPAGVFTVLAELDGRYLSTEVAGGFTGRVIGLYAAEGIVRFDWFDYEPLGEAQA
jgi:xylan 1,4-beta-xylosidase